MFPPVLLRAAAAREVKVGVAAVSLFPLPPCGLCRPSCVEFEHCCCRSPSRCPTSQRSSRTEGRGERGRGGEGDNLCVCVCGCVRLMHMSSFLVDLREKGRAFLVHPVAVSALPTRRTGAWSVACYAIGFATSVRTPRHLAPQSGASIWAAPPGSAQITRNMWANARCTWHMSWGKRQFELGQSLDASYIPIVTLGSCDVLRHSRFEVAFLGFSKVQC